MSARVLQFAPAVACTRDQMSGILFAQECEGFVKSGLLDKTVRGKVPARGISGNEILFGQEALGSSVIACGEVDLGKPKGIFVIVWQSLAHRHGENARH